MTEKSCTLLLAENHFLETDRLLLRPITLGDTEDIFDYVSDEETMAFIFTPHTSHLQTKEFIANYYLKNPLGFYALEHKKDRKMIGVIEFRVDDKKRAGEIGYMLNRDYWGQGLTTEACLRILSLSFDTLSLERITSGHDTGNESSARVLNKIGMSLEYIDKDAYELNGNLVDTFHYHMTRESYFTKKKEVN